MGLSTTRYSSIDDFRGFSVFLMFIANFIVLFTQNPPLVLDHARPDVFLPLDLVAPLFGFAIGLCLPLTLAHARDRQDPVFGRVAWRVALLFVIGYVPDFYYRFSAEAGVWQTATGTWGILETWALGYVVAFLLCYVRLEYRLFIAGGLALVYQLLFLELSTLSGMVLRLVEGGPAAVLSWSVIIVTGTVYGELLFRGPRDRFLTGGLALGTALGALGFLLHLVWVPLDRVAVSAAYTVFGAGVAAWAFLVFELWRPAWGVVFREAGKYPLTAWVLQILVYGPVLLTVGMAHFPWPAAGLLAVVSAVAVFIAASLARRAGLRLKV